ncbi:MAG: hypothetical protein ABIT96_03315 [Ferruginibacter sp.]
MKNIFMGTVGYHNLRNHSIGPALLPLLQSMEWPANVEIDELNWGPIAVVQKFQALPNPFSRVILIAAVERPGRSIGEISLFRWMGNLPDEEMIQRCIGDAVTGVISIDNLLIIGEFFKIWPAETFVLNIEPGPEQAGETLTEDMKQSVPEIVSTLQNLAVEQNAEMIKFIPLYGDTLIET